MCMTKGGREARREQLSAVQREVATTTTNVTIRKKKKLGVTYGSKKIYTKVRDPNSGVRIRDASAARRANRAARAGTANVQMNSRFAAKRPKTGSLRIDASGAQVSGGAGGIV